MSDIIDLDDYKRSKEKTSELKTILQIIDGCLLAFSYFPKYRISMEVMSLLKTHRTLIEIQIEEEEKDNGKETPKKD